MPLSPSALRTFAEDYRVLSATSRDTRSYELGRASGLLRKFIWPTEGADAIRAQLGIPGQTVIQIQQFTQPVAADTVARAHLIIPHLSVLSAAVSSYYAIPVERGRGLEFQSGTVSKVLDLAAYCDEPFASIDGTWITRRHVVSYFAYEAGHVHHQLTLGAAALQAKIRSVGKLQLPNGMVRDDMGFFWVGPGGDAGRALMLLGEKYEIRELLLLQVIVEVVNAPSVTELVVEIELRRLTGRL